MINPLGIQWVQWRPIARKQSKVNATMIMVNKDYQMLSLLAVTLTWATIVTTFTHIIFGKDIYYMAYRIVGTLT